MSYDANLALELFQQQKQMVKAAVTAAANTTGRPDQSIYMAAYKAYRNEYGWPEAETLVESLIIMQLPKVDIICILGDADALVEIIAQVSPKLDAELAIITQARQSRQPNGRYPKDFWKDIYAAVGVDIPSGNGGLKTKYQYVISIGKGPELMDAIVSAQSS